MKLEQMHSLSIDILNQLGQLKKKKEEMNIALNTQTGQIYVGGIKPKNKLYSDEKGYYLIDGFDKFMGKKYAIRKYFSPIENVVLSNYMNDTYEDGGGVEIAE
jgi:hypothetical protein